jgi:class 3 adenylate cyclase/tetratricopeptide (TPR) repeat protein
MRCSRCQHENPAGQKFCGECGTRLASGCPACGTANPPGQKFCGECGGALDQARASPKFASPDVYTPKYLAERILTSRAALEGERKQVTVLFADIKGSLELIESSDPEQADLLLDSVLSAMMDAVHRYEGTVNKVLGDGIMALFGAPLAHEDHAVRACYAALAMQDALRRVAEQARARFGVEPQIRIGLNSGEVVVRAIGNDLFLHYDAIGPTAHLANRMEQLALPGTIRLTQSTLHLAEGFARVSPLGPVPVKGLEHPIEIYELQGATPTRSRFQVAVARGLTRFVGRDTEIAALGGALNRAAQGRGQVFAVVGDPGVGKSRLVYEFTRSHRTAGMLVLESRSVSYGKAAIYLPVIDLLKAYYQIDDRDDVRRIREKVTGKLLTLDEGLRPASSALLSLLDVQVDDPAWSALEPSERRRHTLEAIKTVLLRESEVQPLVIVFEDLHWVDSETQAFLDSLVESLPTARILLLVNYRPDYQHGWAGRSYYTQRRIDPLLPENAEELLRDLLGDDPSLARLKELILKQGNPFFLEETVRTLVETGSLGGARGAYRLLRPLQALQIPPTVQAILTARIDRLPPADKQLLQAASVVGKDVPYAILQAIAGLPEDALHRGLADLQEHEFLYEARLFPDREYTFKHALTHEVTYGSLLAERRRALHERIVETTLRLYPDRPAEHVERLAHHSVRGELWERAVDFLRQAGAKAAARSAYREAAANFEQTLVALDHLPETQDTLRQGIDLRFELRSSLQALGEHERVVEHLRAAEAQAASLGDQGRLGWASAYLSQYLWRIGEPLRAEELGKRALTIAMQLDDFQLQVVANFFPGQGYFLTGDYRRAIDHYRRNVAILTGERAHKRFGLTGLPSVLSRIWLAWSLAERGEFADAMVTAQEALSIAEAAGQPYSVAAACLGVGQVQLMRGALAQATFVLERAAEMCRTADLPLIRPATGTLLGLAYALQGQVTEALSLLEESEAETPSVRIFDTSTARTALGTGYLLAGRLSAAGEAASGAAELAAAREFRGTQAWAGHLLGEISAHRDPPEVASPEEHYRRALALAEELGMLPLVAHCHRGLGQLYHCVGERQKAEQQVAIALAMYRDMDMGFWQQKTEVDLQ